MNERTEALAKQAAEYAIEFAVKDQELYIPKLMEKFAELMIRECAQLAMTEHHSTSPAEYDEMEPYEQGCDDTASAISGKIRRIFGVE